jgi:hypothetical protein
MRVAGWFAVKSARQRRAATRKAVSHAIPEFSRGRGGGAGSIREAPLLADLGNRDMS